MRTTVFITIDVELSMGGAWSRADLEPLGPEACIWCRLGDGSEHGIRRIMSILEARGLPGVFFVDTSLSDLFPAETFRSVCREIIDRGHDVQLHVHPAACDYARRRRNGPLADRPAPKADCLWARSPEEQEALLREGLDRLEDLCGRRPVAFRAGNYAADDVSLAAMEAAGLLADFSGNLHYRGTTSRITRHANAPMRVGGLVEVPVTQLLGHCWPGRGPRPLEVNSIGRREMRQALEQLHRGGARAASIVLHSFSLLKRREGRGERARPDGVVTGRLEALAAFLDRNRDRFRVATVAECLDGEGGLDVLVAGPDVWPKNGPLGLAGRFVGQVLSRL